MKNERDITAEAVQKEVEYLLSMGIPKEKALLMAGTHLLLKKLGYIDAPAQHSDGAEK